MSKKFTYEITILNKQIRILEQKAWDIKMKDGNYISEPYVVKAVEKIYKSRDELKEAIEILKKGEE